MLVRQRPSVYVFTYKNVFRADGEARMLLAPAYGSPAGCGEIARVSVQRSAAVAARAVNSRASITNDPRRLRADVDKRSVDGRLFCDLYDSIAAEFPGAEGSKVRALALLRFDLEKARAAGTLTLEDAVRVDHLLERREKALRLALQRQRMTEAPEGLRSRLSARYGKGAAP
jgi:hypothetical protein